MFPVTFIIYTSGGTTLTGRWDQTSHAAGGDLPHSPFIYCYEGKGRTNPALPKACTPVALKRTIGAGAVNFVIIFAFQAGITTLTFHILLRG